MGSIGAIRPRNSGNALLHVQSNPQAIGNLAQVAEEDKRCINRSMYRAFQFLENKKLITEILSKCFIPIFYRICLPKSKYRCIILKLIIRSFLWQLYVKVVLFF